PYEIEGLSTGVTYTLREVLAPDGYLITNDTTFSISAEGELTSTGTTSTDENGNTILVVNDRPIHVEVSKTDITGEEELEGADIKVLRKAGENEPEGTKYFGENNEYVIVEEWKSTTEAHEIERLKTGVEYILRETVAPDGYTIAADTKFTIDE
ncbi:SpaA isopeptide-forming pilin-related protein, partial [Vibrio sp. FNV 38]|nr:SpaA isopeptide-forming pilin-related protein [Vibrio sp. FNV 38]